MFKLIGTSLSIISTLALLLPTSAYSSENRVSFVSYGPARIGMSRRALEAALGSKLTEDDATEDPQSCEVVAPVNGCGGVNYMLIDGIVARIDVSSENVKTVSGAQVGTSQSAIMAIYPGRVAVTPHFYTAPEGSYLTMLSRDKRNGMRFETERGKVARYYAGTAEAIQYVEGCQ